MFLTLKILHVLALAIGIGGGVSNAIIGAVAGPKDPALAGAVQRRIGRASFVALIVLWATGFAMLALGPGAAAFGLWFWLKMLAVVALTAAALRMQVAVLRGDPAVARLARPLGMAATGSAILAAIFAVLAFG